MNGHRYPTHKFWSPDQVGRQPTNAPAHPQYSGPPTPLLQGQHQNQQQQLQHAPQQPFPSSQVYPMQQFAASSPHQSRRESSGGSLLKTFNFFSSKPAAPKVYNAPQQQAPPPPPPRPLQTPLHQQQQKPVYNSRFPQRHSPQQQEQQHVSIRHLSQTHSGPQLPQLQNFQQPNPPPIPQATPPQPQYSAPPPPYTQPPVRPPVEISADAPPRTPHSSTPPPRSEPAPVELHSSPVLKREPPAQTPPPPPPPGPPPPPPKLPQFPPSEGSMNSTTITTIKTTTTVINTSPSHRSSIGIPGLPIFPGAYPEEPKKAPSPPPLPPPLPPPPLPPTLPQQPKSKHSLNLKNPENPISANVTNKARGSADLFWGYLFDESISPPEPKPILKEFFEQLAGYLITTWEKHQSAVISPDSMAMYYASLTERGSSRLDFFVSAATSPNPIIALYQILGCQYLLIPPRYKPPVGGIPRAGSRKVFMQPGLTNAGFVQWMIVNTLIDPQREFIRLNRLLQTPGVVIPRRDPTAPPYPDILPRGALPEAPDGAVLERWGGVFRNFEVGNEVIADRISWNLQEWENGIEGGVGHMGPGTAGGIGSAGVGMSAEKEKDEEIRMLKVEIEELKKAMWEKDLESKRSWVQISQMQQREQQLQQQQEEQAAMEREADLRRMLSTSSTVSTVSSRSTVHSRPDFGGLYPQPTIHEGPEHPSPVPTPMPEPYIPGYDTVAPRDEKQLSLNHRQTMPNLPHDYGMTPTPPSLPRHSTMGSIDTGRGGSAVGYRPFQPLTPGSGGGNGNEFGGVGAAERRRSSAAYTRETLPPSLCISPVQENHGGCSGRNGSMSPVAGPGVSEGFRRNDEFARILGADV